MLSFWICSVILYIMISNVLAFTPISDYQCTIHRGQRSTTMIIKSCDKTSNSDSRLVIYGYKQTFPRNLALSMATKLKFSDDENGMTNSTVQMSSRFETLLPRAKILTIEMAKHVPLGCTVEESLHVDDNFIFISKLTKKGHAEGAGLEVGDVVVGVTGLFGELACTIDATVEQIKRLVSAVPQEDPLTIQIARGTNILERHESTIVDLCSVAGTDDKEVLECVVDFLAGGYDYDYDAVEDDNDGGDETECDYDEDAEFLIDGMMNLWADELPPPSTTTGITEQSVKKTAKPKPWSSRSSPSGTWVRDPKTGKMRNIDA